MGKNRAMQKICLLFLLQSNYIIKLCATTKNRFSKRACLNFVRLLLVRNKCNVCKLKSVGEITNRVVTGLCQH